MSSVSERIKAMIPPETRAKLRRRRLDLKGWRHRTDLAMLATIYGSDKWGSHWYAKHYQHHFQHLRTKRINLLEIGVGGFDNPRRGGASLRMWKRYFPHGRIFAIDIFDKSPLQEDRIKIFRGSQTDPEFLNWVVKQIGDVDIIIDDGSHINEHVLISFDVLFPQLKMGGIYAIEDMQTAYWPHFGGSEDPHYPDSSIALGKRLVDGLNWEEFFEREPQRFDREIKGLHFYHNLMFIDKDKNEEGSNKEGNRVLHWQEQYDEAMQEAPESAAKG